MELKLHDGYDFPTHDIFIGELVQTYADDAVMKDGKIDITRVRPLLFDMASVKYHRLGPAVGNCWESWVDARPITSSFSMTAIPWVMNRLVRFHVPAPLERREFPLRPRMQDLCRRCKT